MSDRRFDADTLYQINADQLKRMARMWGAKAVTRKDECVELITSGLADPDKIRAAYQSLSHGNGRRWRCSNR